MDFVIRQTWSVLEGFKGIDGWGDAEMVIYIIDDLHNISVFDDIITSTINIITNSTLLMFLYNTIQIIASFEIKNTLQKIILDTFTVT